MCLVKLAAVLAGSEIMPGCVAGYPHNIVMPVEYTHETLNNALNPLFHSSYLLLLFFFLFCTAVTCHKIKIAELPLIILRQLGHLVCVRSAAFRPLLTKGLALSGNLM